MDYVKILDEIENKIVNLLRHGDQPINIGELIEKAKKADVSKSDTIIRDAIMCAGGKGKLKIELIKPKQLLISIARKEEVE
jgi:hypothetical protein